MRLLILAPGLPGRTVGARRHWRLRLTLAMLLWQSALAPVCRAADYDHWLWAQLAGPARQGESVSAAATIVSADRVLAQRAVGYADPRTDTVADAADTAYRISSITKLFTAVALAQLLESGQIQSLQDPANRYLSEIRLPLNEGREITIEHLITHTAGFDYWQFGLYSTNPGVTTERRLAAADVMPLLPPYVSPAGRWAVYSNTGGALLGVLVEQVSGMALGQYLRTRLFTPLRMSATRLQDSPSVVASARSYYVLGGGSYIPQPSRAHSRLMNLSMGAQSSAHDMGRFMRMLLRGGELDGVRVLSPASVALLMQPRFRNHAAANGFGVLFDIAQQTPTTRLYMHNGATPGFNAHLLLAPEQDLAMFAVVAGSKPGGVESAAAPELLSAPGLLARFVREWIAPYEFPYPSRASDGEIPEGDYLTLKRPQRSPEALFSLFRPSQQIRVQAVAGKYYSNGRPATQVAPGVYLAEGPYAYREMFSVHDGEPVMYVYGSNVLNSVRWWQQPSLRKGAAAVALAACCVGLLVILFCGGRRLSPPLFCLCLVGLILLLVWPSYVGWQPAGIGSLFLQVQLQQRLPLQVAVTLSHLLLVWGALWWLAMLSGYIHRGATRLAGLQAIAAAVGTANLVLLAVLAQLNLLGPTAWRWWLA